jgi:hypothetical protein
MVSSLTETVLADLDEAYSTGADRGNTDEVAGRVTLLALISRAQA